MTIWKPLLEGESADRARTFVTRASEMLAASRVTDPSVAYGLTGVALLHGFRAMAGEAEPDLALATMERVVENIEERSTPWLFVGYAGIGLTAQLLAPVLGDQEELLADLDSLIFQTLDRTHWNHEWELQVGLIGLGVYAVTRGAEDRELQVFDHLVSVAHTDESGVSWATHGLDGPPNFNLGMPHGVVGAIALLSLLCRADRSNVRDLLARAVRWLRLQENRSKVPAFGQETGAPTRRSTFTPMNGWCYGDAVTALVLARAAYALDEPLLREAALDLARLDARRTPETLSACSIDETFCHGAVGRAHLFHELALVFEDDELAAAARRWYSIALEQPLITDQNFIGLQTGLAGRALAMLASYSELPPTWGRILLIR